VPTKLNGIFILYIAYFIFIVLVSKNAFLSSLADLFDGHNLGEPIFVGGRMLGVIN
jgi:hypothetical protein